MATKRPITINSCFAFKEVDAKGDLVKDHYFTPASNIAEVQAVLGDKDVAAYALSGVITDLTPTAAKAAKEQ
jgi:hypothetical protein